MHWDVGGASGGDITGAACAVPGASAIRAPAPAIAIPVAYGYMDCFISSSFSGSKSPQIVY
jgi:hypothetical protein